MATVVHYHHLERTGTSSGLYWMAGIMLFVLALLLIAMAMTNRPDVVAFAPSLIEPPIMPPAIPFLPLM